MKRYKCPACRNRVGVLIDLSTPPICWNHPRSREMLEDTTGTVVEAFSLPEGVYRWICNSDSRKTRALAATIDEHATIVPCGQYKSYRLTAEFPGLAELVEVCVHERDFLAGATTKSADEMKLLRSLTNCIASIYAVAPTVFGEQ